MLFNPYSQYNFFANYTRTVGIFCSLLFTNKFCTIDDIDAILSNAQLFKNIEEAHNPLLLTSSEQIWMSLFLQDKQFSKLFSQEIKQKLLNLQNETDLRFDWLSMWSGDIIASLAIRYDVPMGKIISIMPFEEFMKHSVALHGHPKQYIYEIFDSCPENTLQSPDCQNIPQRCIEFHNFYILEKEQSELILSSLGFANLTQELDKKFVLASSSRVYDRCGLMGVLGALFPNQNISITLKSSETNPILQELYNITDITATDINNYDGYKIANWFGSWNKYRPWYEQAKDGDRGKYLDEMMSYFMLLKINWCEENFKNPEKIILPASRLLNTAKAEADYRNAFMKIPLRP